MGLGESSQHAHDLIDQIVREAACPVIAILETDDRDFVNKAAKRGIFARIADEDAEQLQSSLDIVLRRFAEFQNLEGAFARRALIERAKGILMERHDLDESSAFQLMPHILAAATENSPTSPTRLSTGAACFPARPDQCSDGDLAPERGVVGVAVRGSYPAAPRLTQSPVMDGWLLEEWLHGGVGSWVLRKSG